MAVVPICYKMYYKDQNLSILKEQRNKEGCITFFVARQEVSSCFSLSSKKTSRGHLHISSHASVLSRVHKAVSHIRSRSANASRREKLPTVCCAVESSSSESQLRSLDSYFEKLQDDANHPPSNSLNSRAEFFDGFGQSKAKKGLVYLDDYLGKLHNRADQLLDRSGQSKAENGLGSLDDYLGKVNEDAKSKDYVSFASDDETTEAAPYSVKGGSGNGVNKLKNYMKFKNDDGQGVPKSSYDETSSLYLISMLAAVNIAVFLFEIASPIRNSAIELCSLPLLYGAKINNLILLGEWWRLVTPMFLHSGILHVTLGCWVLLTFGPQVCRTYGSFTFFLIYILGGLSGNLISFLHTPELTVGGTGPVFAVIGAWLINQTQNRDAITKDSSESMFQKAIVAAALSCILSNFAPIDDWAHVGAALTGIAYGFLTCPMLQTDDASSRTGQEDGITLISHYADPCKSLAFFSLFILVLISLLFIIEPPIDSLAAGSFV